MEIDTIIGNPPYQEELGGGTVITSKRPLYQQFVERSLEISSRHVCMIIPSRWVGRGIGLADLYSLFESYRDKITDIVDYLNTNNDVFQNVQVAGGIMYFNIDKQRAVRESEATCNCLNIQGENRHREQRILKFEPAFVRDNMLNRIVEKVSRLKEQTLESKCKYTPFGIGTNEVGLSEVDENRKADYYKTITSTGWVYVPRENVTKGKELIDKYKVAISGTISGGGRLRQDNCYKVIGTTMVLSPGEICTGTYLTVGGYDTRDVALEVEKYIRTKFIRALILSTFFSMHFVPRSLLYVPEPDLTTEISDLALYIKYGLDMDEVDYIERIISSN